MPGRQLPRTVPPAPQDSASARDYPLPYDKLAAAESDEEQIQILTDLLKLSGTKIPGGIIEHLRTSWLDNRAIPTADLKTYNGDRVLNP